MEGWHTMTDDPRKWVQIIDDLRSRIDDGKLQKYDLISITYEEQARGVSRPTIRKALQKLEAEGRVRRYPGHGYVVLG